MTTLNQFREIAAQKTPDLAAPVFIEYARKLTSAQGEMTRVERIQAACAAIEDPTDNERAVMFIARQTLGFDVPR